MKHSKKLDNKIAYGENLYTTLIEKIIYEPHRYVSNFRLSNPKEKIIQNLSQSREIKFGDFIEEIANLYI
ncbi:hypothetical protein [Mycoplasmopsis columbina]|uniref:hypothetical protein n=1 Tax=Mycoplasmopsis columbina TaxID=114881 RepID=UPI00068E057F|nr:hypothetical protein [Mycoplasmopsis columbina]VEU77042.1 Uncharacterised protein [Mycoplasmopsis columbina]